MRIHLWTTYFLLTLLNATPHSELSTTQNTGAGLVGPKCHSQLRQNLGWKHPQTRFSMRVPFSCGRTLGPTTSASAGTPGCFWFVLFLCLIWVINWTMGGWGERQKENKRNVFEFLTLKPKPLKAVRANRVADLLYPSHGLRCLWSSQQSVRRLFYHSRCIDGESGAERGKELAGGHLVIGNSTAGWSLAAAWASQTKGHQAQHTLFFL